MRRKKKKRKIMYNLIRKCNGVKIKWLCSTHTVYTVCVRVYTIINKYVYYNRNGIDSLRYSWIVGCLHLVVFFSVSSSFVSFFFSLCTFMGHHHSVFSFTRSTFGCCCALSLELDSILDLLLIFYFTEFNHHIFSTFHFPFSILFFYFFRFFSF